MQTPRWRGRSCRRRRSCWPAPARRRPSSPGCRSLPPPVAGAAAWAGTGGVAVPRKAAGERIDPCRARRAVARFVHGRPAGPGPLRHGRATGPGRARCATGSPRSATASTTACTSAGASPAGPGPRRGDDRRSTCGSVQAELAELPGRAAPLRPPAAGADRSTRRIAALRGAAGVGPAHRTASASDARDRLRLLNAQLDEAVARAIELSVQARRRGRRCSRCSPDVENVVGELEALRQGLEEVGGGTAR